MLLENGYAKLQRLARHGISASNCDSTGEGVKTIELPAGQAEWQRTVEWLAIGHGVPS